jgi:hypothetical protein
MVSKRSRNGPTAETRTFVLTLKNGNTRKITIPTTWKMTFGSIVPYSKGNTGDHHGVALRLYEGTKENLRAVMADVVAVRDASISIVEKRTSVQRKATQKATPKGMKDVVVEARVTEWVDPDAEDDDDTAPNEFLQLTNQHGE